MSFLKLNLPEYSLKTAEKDGVLKIYDAIRKKWVVLSPEEWVRQNFIQFLVQHQDFPASLIGVEVSLKMGKLSKRADILIYDTKAQPLVLVECKAPNVEITEEVLFQIARYNSVFKVEWLIVTNGLNHFCFKKDTATEQYIQQNSFPKY